MRRLFIALLLSCAAGIVATSACDDDDVVPDGGPRVPERVCTTQACAQAPCTAGCLFRKKGDPCAGDLPAEIAGDAAAACARFCGFPSKAYGQPIPEGKPSQGGSCGHYTPGCCNFHPSCYRADASYGQDEAVICPDGTTCYDNSQPPPADLYASCDDLSSRD